MILIGEEIREGKELVCVEKVKCEISPHLTKLYVYLHYPKFQFLFTSTRQRRNVGPDDVEEILVEWLREIYSHNSGNRSVSRLRGTQKSVPSLK